MLHHTGKGETTQEYRGSSDWKAAIDVGYTMRNLGESRLTNLSLKSFKARFIVSDVVAITYRYGIFNAEDIPQAAEDGSTQLLRDNAEVTKGEFEKMAIGKGFTRKQARDFVNDGAQAGKVRLLVGMNNTQRIRLSAGEPLGMLV